MGTPIGTRKLKLKLASGDVTAEVSVVEITAGATESDFVSFEDAAGDGGRDYALHIVAVQDTTTGSVWDKVWTAAGTDVAASVNPHGNGVPSATQPHFEGTVTIKEPDGVLVGGQANASASGKFTIDVTWPFTAKPTKKTTA